MNESRELREKMKNNEKFLFQISEAARACGVSRSTLLRMEEKGLLKPAHVSEESGRRYYDNFNVAQIMQVEKFKRRIGIQVMRVAKRSGRIAVALRRAGHLFDQRNDYSRNRLRYAQIYGTHHKRQVRSVFQCLRRVYTQGLPPVRRPSFHHFGQERLSVRAYRRGRLCHVLLRPFKRKGSRSRGFTAL